MGILVPPCLTMVVLGSLVNLSIVTLFLAGFVPAFLLAAVLLVLIADPRAAPGLAGQPARDASADLLPGDPPRGGSDRPAGDCSSAASSPASTTVTEAALLAVVYALVAGIALGRHPPRPACSVSSPAAVVVTATTLWVLAAASAFAWILVREWVPQTLGEWIAGVGAGKRRACWR